MYLNKYYCHIDYYIILEKNLEDKKMIQNKRILLYGMLKIFYLCRNIKI